MAIPLTEELLGFDEKIEEAPGPEGGAFGGSGDFGGRGDCDASVCFGGSSDGGGGSLMMVKAAVLHELSVPVRRSKSLVLPDRRRLSQADHKRRIGPSFMSSFRDVRRSTVEQVKGVPVLKGDEGGGTSATATVADSSNPVSDDGETEGGDGHRVIDALAADGDTDATMDAQPPDAVPHDRARARGNWKKVQAATTTDHRHVSPDTEAWKKINKIMLAKAVQSIPAYIERSSLVVVLVPPCKHADRDEEICDQSSWRGRGWCRVEYLGAALVRSEVSVMLVEDAITTPAFVFPFDGLQLPPGHGTYTYVCAGESILDSDMPDLIQAEW